MGGTLISFIDKYYKYGGDKPVDEKGLTIGGYASAWLADLVAAYVFECTMECFDDTNYFGIYRDDGIAVFKGNQSSDDILNWLNVFQDKVNNLAANDFLQFTAVIWSKDRPTVCNNNINGQIGGSADVGFKEIEHRRAIL
jgi:hypothetical protein